MSIMQGLDDASMRAVLGRHDTLVRSALGATSGYEVKREGTAFMYVFKNAADAVRGALALQESWERVDWIRLAPSLSATVGGPPIRVSVGIHAGDVHQRTDPLTGRWDYVGTPVNVAARLSQAAAGGQILMSREALMLASETGFSVENPGSEGASLAMLGDYEVRGIAIPIQVAEIRPLTQQNKRTRPPPSLRPSQVQQRTVGLPELVGRTFGRDDDLTELAEAVRQGDRLLTLHGPAGCGKSRLALELARRVSVGELEPRAQSAEWIPLARARMERDIVAAVAGVLQVSLLEREAVTQLGTLLKSQGPLLVIFDDAEAVSIDLGRLIMRWRDLAPDAVFLATTRATLRIAGERVLVMGPLPVPEGETTPDLAGQSPAVRMFFDCLVSAGGPRPDPDLLLIVGRAAIALDGLPLALEAVARTMASLPREHLMTELDRWTRSEPRGLAPGEPAAALLRTAINRSLIALPAWASAALAALSVLRGSFTVEGAEAVIDLRPWPDAPAALDVASLLVEHSLTATLPTQSGVPRLVLSAVMLAHASERLAQQGNTLCLDAERRHGEFYSAWGRDGSLTRLRARTSRGHLGALEADRENLEIALLRAVARNDARVARRSCRALLSLLERRGPIHRVPLLVEPVLGMPGLHPGDAANLHCLAAQSLMSAGLLDHALSHVTRGLVRLKEYELPAVRARFMMLTARIAVEAKDPARALELANAAAAAAREASDPRSIAITSMYVGFLCSRGGRCLDANRSFETALRAIRDLDDCALELAIRRMQAIVKMKLGHPTLALRTLRELVEIAVLVGDTRSEARILVSLTTVATALGQLETAQQAIHQALILIGAFREPSAVAAAQRALGVLRNRQERPYEAIDCFNEAGRLYTDMHRPIGRGICAAERGLAWMQITRLDDAYEQLQAGTELLFRGGAVADAATYGIHLAEVLSRMGRTERPLQAATRSIDLLRAVQSPWSLANALARRGALLAQSNPAAATRDLEEAEGLTSQLDLTPELAAVAP